MRALPAAGAVAPSGGARCRRALPAATGAAGVVVGLRAKALAADLKHRLGLSYGKVGDLFHPDSTRGGWQQGDQRLAAHCRPVYEQLVQTLQESAVVHGDETGRRSSTTHSGRPYYKGYWH